MPLAEKRGYADYIIDNTDTRERTGLQVRDVYAKLKQEALRAS
jgi:dephospho-CoA kinase